MRWHQYLAYLTGNDLYSLTLFPMYFEPGRAYFARWNEPPFVPTFPNHNPGALWSYRDGDSMILRTQLFGDKGGHSSGGFRSAHRQTVYRNGEKIAETPWNAARVTVPAEAATYRVESTASQQILPYSTQLSAAWTFQSEHVAEGQPEILPFITLRFEPRLNEQGQAECGARFTLPITTYQTDQQGPVRVANLSLEVSFDDGASWTRVPVVQQGSQWIATYEHPQNAQFVSLRGTASGLSNNTYELTAIRAYGLKEHIPDPTAQRTGGATTKTN